jgi:DNA-binding NarL/FixJ family response regulator
MIRIVLADDHAMLRLGLATLLREQGDMCIEGEAGTADELFTLLSTIRTDVVVLDVAMPGPGLIAVLKRLCDEHPTIRTIVLSMYAEEQYALRALKAGAVGYLTKDRSPQLLVTAVRKVMQGGRFVTESLAEHMAAGLSPDSTRPPHEQLSDREFEILKGLGSGLSIKSLAGSMGISPKTASTYRTRLLEKLVAKSNADLVRYAINHGLVEP